MIISSTIVLGALPIREQPSYPPETGFSPLEVGFLVAVLLALGVIAVLAVLNRRRRREQLAFDEKRVRAAMEQLCRHGWIAHLTLYGSRVTLPGDAPEVEGIRVRLDWAELADGADGEREVAVARRLWSRSVAGALRAMVEDRRLDLELEEIERAHAGRERSE